MIVYDLRCSNGHVEEQWFESIEEYEARVAEKGVKCPRCADRAVVRLLAAPRISPRGSAEPLSPCGRAACPVGGCVAAD